MKIKQLKIDEALVPYRFADRFDEVNWRTKYGTDYNFIQGLIPKIHKFLDRSIRAVTFDGDNLSAVIGISGGLDSSLAAWLTAETMRQAKKDKSAKDTRLVLLAFKGTNEEDLAYARKFARVLRAGFDDIKIEYQERDITRLLNEINNCTDGLVISTRSQKVYPGDLPIRLIDCMVLEYANKSGHCSIDSTNRSEVALGELALGTGAECAPVADFYKSQVFDLAEIMGLPEFTLSRQPINSALGCGKIASYFGEVPRDFTPREIYRVLDPVLFSIYDKGYSPAQVAESFGHSTKFTEKIHRWVKSQDYKRQKSSFSFENLDKGEIKEFMETSLLQTKAG